MKTTIERILSDLGEEVMNKLSSQDLTWADLHTLLLYIFEARTKNISPADIMKNHKNSRFSSISSTSPVDLIKIDKILYDIIPDYFVPIELSPVNSLGVNSVLTALDPKIVLPTIRNLEIVGDSSMALTIECAKIRDSLKESAPNQETHLASSHRALRVQSFSKGSDLMTHFRAFALVSGGRDTKGFNGFELSSLYNHIKIWLDFLQESNKNNFYVNNLSVAISDIRIMEKLINLGLIEKDIVIKRTKDKTFNPFKDYKIDLPSKINSAKDIPVKTDEFETNIKELQLTEKQIVSKLRSDFENVEFYFDLQRCSGLGYYSGLCYKISAKNKLGNNYSLAGGGACSWTQKLLQNKKEHLITSGFGTEFFNKHFKEN